MPRNEGETPIMKNETIIVLRRCIAALTANGAPNCEAVKEARGLLAKLGPMEKPVYRLEFWSYSSVAHSITGNVYDNPKFKNGSIVYTSKVLKLDLENKVAETENSIYKLS